MTKYPSLPELKTNLKLSNISKDFFQLKYILKTFE